MEKKIHASIKFLLYSFYFCCHLLPLMKSFSHLPPDEPVCTRDPQVNIHKLQKSIINLSSACVCLCIYDRTLFSVAEEKHA